MMVRSRAPRPGQALVLFAISSLVLMGFVGLVADGGISYVQRRMAQNAADLIARAGAAAKGNGGSDSVVLATVSAAAVTNGFAPMNVAATYIDSTGSYMADVGRGTPPTTAAGVRATVTARYTTFLASLFGRDQDAVSATAAMTIGSLVGFNGGAPLMVCSNGILYPSLESAGPLLNADGSIRSTPVTIDGVTYPSPIGREFLIWGNNVGYNPVCTPEGGNSWKGLADNGTSGNVAGGGATCTALPCAYGTTSGTVEGPTQVKLAQAVSYGGQSYNGCDLSSYAANSSGCVLLAPIGDNTTTNCNGFSMAPVGSGYMCVRGWGAFLLTNPSGCNGANCRQTGVLLGNVFVVNGAAGEGGPGPNTIGPKAFAAIE